MIADIGEAGHVGKAANYCSRNNNAELASTNIDTDIWQDAVSEIESVTALRPDASDPVKTHVISLADGESLTKEQWKEVIDKYMKDMGYENAPYAAWIHKDTDNEHVHIVASRVNYDGSLVRTSNDYYKGQKEMRQFEKELGLQVGQNSWEIRDGAAKTAELKSYEKSGNVPDRLVLQEHIKEALHGQPSLQEFRHRLEDRGVTVHLNESKTTGRISGISYEYEGRTYKGSDIGNGSKWGEVQKGLDLSGKVQEKAPEKAQEPTKDQARPLEPSGPAAPLKSPHSPERQEVDRIKGEIDSTWQTQKAAVQSLQTRMQFLQDRIQTQTEYMHRDQAGLKNRGDLAEVRRAYAPEIRALRGEQRELKAQERAIKEQLQAKRLDLVEQRYRAEVRAINTEFRGRGQEGSPKHLERLERADQYFAKDAGRIAKEMERSVKAKEAWAERAGRTPNLAVDRKGQALEVGKGVGLSLAEASKAGGRILQHQAQHAKEISGAARDFLKTRSPEAKGRLVETVGRALESFKRDLSAASERLKEAWGKVGERVATLNERTRPKAVESRINRTLEAVKTERSSHGLALGHDAGPGARRREEAAEHQGRGEGRSREAASAGPGHGADRHRVNERVGDLHAKPNRDAKLGRGTEGQREGLEAGGPEHKRAGVEAPGSGSRRRSDPGGHENRAGFEGSNTSRAGRDGSKDRGIAPGGTTEAHRGRERDRGAEGRPDRSQGHRQGLDQHVPTRRDPVKQPGALVQGQPVSRSAEAASLNLPNPAGKAAKAAEVDGGITNLSQAMNRLQVLKAAVEKDPQGGVKQVAKAGLDAVASIASPAVKTVSKALEKGFDLER